MKMIDVGEKERTSRLAIARAELRCSRETLKLLNEGRLENGEAPRPRDGDRLGAPGAQERGPQRELEPRGRGAPAAGGPAAHGATGEEGPAVGSWSNALRWS